MNKFTYFTLVLYILIFLAMNSIFGRPMVTLGGTSNIMALPCPTVKLKTCPRT